MRRTLCVCLIALLAVAAPARAEAPPNTSGSYSYTPDSGSAGTVVTATAHCVWGGSGDGVTFRFTIVYKTKAEDGSAYSFGGNSVAAAPDGSAQTNVTIPSGAYVGDYYATGACNHGSSNIMFKTGQFTVTGAAAPNQKPPSRTPPTTTAAGVASPRSGVAPRQTIATTGRAGAPSTTTSSTAPETTVAVTGDQTFAATPKAQPDYKARVGLLAIAVGFGLVVFAWRSGRRPFP